MNSEITHIVLIVLTDLAKQDVVAALLDGGHHVTEIGSTSSLFTTGFSTLLVGVSAQDIDAVLRIVREHCHTAFDPGEKRAIAYILRVDAFGQLQAETKGHTP